MDLKKIHYFFKAVEYKNFTQAANACHIGQTTMSKYSTNEYLHIDMKTTDLVYLKQNKSENLNLLLRHIHKKC